MRRLFAVAGFTVAAALAALAGARADEVRDRGLTVHEWGTFTSIAGEDGTALDWRPLSGPSDLPSFVYGSGGGRAEGLRFGKLCEGCKHVHCACGAGCKPDAEGRCGCKGCGIATVRMETPVLYFYAEKETAVRVKVGFPKGKITEWYPKARQVGAGIDWGMVTVLPGLRRDLPVEKAESHYYPARETDAALVRVCDLFGGGAPEHEKFLFYRGVGTFDLPLKATLDGGAVKAELAGNEPLAPLVLFERRGDRAGFRTLASLDGPRRLERPALDGKVEDVVTELEAILGRTGLTKKEAHAMVETWRSSWFEDGLRLFYLVPRRITDEVLPLELSPAPRELVRVLVGRLELITPELEAEVLGAVKATKDPEAAAKALAKHGRFAEPILKRALAREKDAATAARFRALLGAGR